MTVELLRTEGHGLLAEVRLGDHVLTVMDDFSSLPAHYPEKGLPEFSCLTLDGYSWEARFKGNPNHEKKFLSRGG